MAIFNTVYGGKGPIPKTGLLGYRPLQNDAKDYSGNGNDGTWTGTESYDSSGGKTGAKFTTSAYQSWRFASSYITTTLNRKDVPVSFVCRYNTSTGDMRQSPMSNYSSSGDNDNGFLIRQDDGTVRVNNGGNYNVVTGTFTTNTWYCIGVTIESGTTKVYLNGTLINTFNNGSNATNYSTWRFGIGITNSNVNRARGFDGLVRHCAVYNRILSADEMKKYYDMTK